MNPEELEAKLHIWGTRGYTDESKEYYRVPVEHINEMKAAFKSILAALKEKDELLKKQSDGYHTMEELYEHRFALYLALCAQNKEICSYTLEREYPGWLCLFMEAQRGKHCLGQISYHLPLKFLPVVEKLFRHHQDNVFDGHTSKDVIARLLALSADEGSKNG